MKKKNVIIRPVRKGGIVLGGRLYLFDDIHKYVGREVIIKQPNGGDTDETPLLGRIRGTETVVTLTEAKQVDRLASVEAVIEVLEQLKGTYRYWDVRDLVSVLEAAGNIVCADTILRIRVAAVAENFR